VSQNGTVSTGIARGSEVAYRWNICESEWSFRSRWHWIIKRETKMDHVSVSLFYICFVGIFCGPFY